MNIKAHSRTQPIVATQNRQSHNLWLVMLLALLMMIALAVTGGAASAHPGITGLDSEVTISVFDRDGGAPITPFRYIINEDTAHQAEDGNVPVFTNPHAYSPIIAEGDETIATITLPPGKYLVSVIGGELPPISGDNPDNNSYKSSGKHFEVDGSGEGVAVAVGLVKGLPGEDPGLPTASIVVEVFHDNYSVNGARDIPVEQGLEGFAVLLEDGTGEVTVDIYGNPICTEYDGDPAGEFPAGNIVAGTGGQCLTDADGVVTIPNMGPLKYGAFVVPPDGAGWIQTSTIEGTPIIDVWVQEGNNGYLAEQGNLTALALFGFVQECDFGLCPQLDANGDPKPPDFPTPPQGTAEIVGRIREISEGVPGVLGPVVPEPYIALNNLSGNDEQVYTGRGNTDGTFSIPNVPPGTYQVVIWDLPLDEIIQFRTVIVNEGDTVIDVGDYGVPRWFGAIEGYAYWDNGIDASGNLITGIPAGFEGPDGAVPGYANGFRDCQPDATGPHDVAKCEDGIAGQDLDIRFKDGSIKYAAFTDANGYYSFDEVFPYPAFMIWEVGFGRFKQVGTMAYFSEPGPDGAPNTPIGYPYNPENMPGCPRDLDGNRDPLCDPADAFGPASLLQGAMTFSGAYHWIDSGKLPYDTGENGGISGLVIYAVTRNEYDPRIAAAEDYEPGVPNVPINLYQADLGANQQPISCSTDGIPSEGCPYGLGELKRVWDGLDPLEEFTGTVIDSVETDSWDANVPTDCRYDDLQGGTIQDPLCLETQVNVNQLKDGVFDGGYAFEGVLAGAYIVEMVAPDGYRQIKEEDQNTDQGDDFIPQVPPPPCAGPLHLVNDGRNPADGQMTPLCDSKFVRVVDGTNPPAEFYVMTDFDDSVDELGDPVLDFGGTAAVPPPGRIRGFMSDDLNIDFVPGSPNYQGKRGVPNTPIGILDFLDNEIAVVNTDDYGYFEVLLPSGDTIACPTPGGICPSMYKVVGNYPGQDPLNPLSNWNPNYDTLTLPTDVWSGKATYSDIAIVPITAFAGFANQPVCTAAGPDVQSVDTVAGPRGTTFNIFGSGFGAAGSVTLGGSALTVNSWADMAINVTIPNSNSQPRGALQLLVTDSVGNTSQTGITFHVTGSGGGPGYTPAILHVGPGQTYATIQDGIDAAGNGTLIIVHPGTYYENPIVYKNVKIQGFGPGTTSIDGRFLGYGPSTGGTDVDTWIAKVDGLNAGDGPVGPTEVPIGQVVTVVATSNNTHNNNQFPTQIDGFTIIGGSTFKVENRAPRATQGGGIYAHAFARRLQVSNNLIQSNGGNAGGGVILGQAYVGTNNNANVRIHHNRLLNNGGFILAGGIGIFNGASDYEIDHNQICGNYSAEYGGGISHFGLSEGGMIHDNEIVFNSAFDEGGGIIIASELSLVPAELPDGSGEVTIEANLIRQNVSNDDGGGIRLLAPGYYPVHIINNMVVNNLATDIGGGIALDDAVVVEIINNTIAHNVSTATAEDADRSPTCAPNGGLETCAHAAGIASTGFSAALLATTPPTTFSDPLMFNNIIWNNEAFHLNAAGNLVPDPAGARPGFIIDLEVLGTLLPQTMTPNYSVLTALYGSGVGNTTNDPLFADNSVFVNFEVLPFVADPTFVSVQVLTTPADPAGNYHLLVGSSAIDLGVTSFGGVAAPLSDIDGDTRGANPDSGADEFVP